MSKPKKTGTCKGCGKPIVIKKKNHEFCARLCRMAYRNRNRENKDEWNTWRGLKERCLSPTYSKYANYGGRGITFAERWWDFDNFLEDMGTRPTPKHELDRIDNDGNYCKENCRWTTHTENMRNSSATKLTPSQARAIRWQHNFGMVVAVDLAQDYRVGKSCIHSIVNNKSWRNIPDVVSA